MHDQFITIPLTHGKVALISPEDEERVSQFKWHVTRNGYAAKWIRKEGNVNGSMLSMHRFVIDAKPGEYVDHINRDRLDNRRANLRIAPLSLNQANSAVRSYNKTGFKGVSWHKSSKRYRCQLQYQGKVYYCGKHTDPIDAAKAHDDLARKVFGEFAWLNFPD